MPLSCTIVVVTRKKMSKRKAMSAIEPADTDGFCRLNDLRFFMMTFIMKMLFLWALVETASRKD